MKIGWKQGSTLGVVLLGLLLASCGYQAASVPQVIRDYELVTGCRLEVLQVATEKTPSTQLSGGGKGCNDNLPIIIIPADGDAHDDWLDNAQPMKAPYGDLLWNGKIPRCLIHVDLGTVIAFENGCGDGEANAILLLRRFAAQMRLALT